VGARQLALLPDGATLINTARGEIVDQDALIVELRSGRIEAVLDVTEPDPLPADSPLWELPGVTLTPHIAGSMGREIGALGAHVVAELARYSRGEPFAEPEPRVVL
ncbi:MAG: NAD(P)-dependent oxidoreductase, partial [Leifsonia sp.]